MYPLQIKEKYDPAHLPALANRFTVVYLGTYLDGDYTEYAGSHPWVDIIPVVPHQEVRCVLDGKVFKVGSDPAYGNYIFIEHPNVPSPETLSPTTTLYSCYEHLDSVCIKQDQELKEGDIIGKTGNTGLSFGEHLHFQIDRKEAPFHAYWPYTGTEAIQAGVTFSQGVNKWLWKDKWKLYTVNPLVYLDMVAAKWSHMSTSSDTSQGIVKKSQDNPIVSQAVDNEPLIVQTVKTTPQPTVAKASVVKKDSFIVTAWGQSTPSVQSDWALKPRFTDIPETDVLAWFIRTLCDREVIEGYEDGTFRPKNAVSRAEFLKMLFLCKGTTLSDDQRSYFTDVPAESWQLKYVNTALANQLVTLKNSKFNPWGTISRVEALKILLGLFLGTVPEGYTHQFTDVDAKWWGAKYVEYATNHSLLSFDSKFYPDQDLTRYEFVGMLKKMS